MSLWESVGTTYVEAATSALPIQRLVVFSAGFVGALAVHKQTHLSIFETIARLPLAQMASLSKGPLSRATIAEVMIGVAIVLAGWATSRLSLRGVFALAARSTDLWSRIKDAQSASKIDESQTLEDRQKAIEIIEASLKESKGRLRAMGAVTELLSGLGVGSLIASHWGNALDALFGLAFLVLAIFIHFFAVQLFLSDYFGPALYKARLQGKAPPTPLRIH